MRVNTHLVLKTPLTRRLKIFFEILFVVLVAFISLGAKALHSEEAAKLNQVLKASPSLS
jgi:hypothetical protein